MNPTQKPTQLAMFVSGHGTNARQIIKYFADHDSINVALVVATKAGIGAIDIANEAGIPCEICLKADFAEGAKLGRVLDEYGITHIVLAGCLAFLPAWVTARYDEKIVNIHPSLLPKYGGKGMHGDHVHQAVLDAKEKESGITIHIVNDEYDAGRIIFQAKCEVKEDDDVDSLATRIHALEHKHFPEVIERWASQQ